MGENSLIERIPVVNDDGERDSVDIHKRTMDTSSINRKGRLPRLREAFLHSNGRDLNVLVAGELFQEVVSGVKWRATE